ncbi:MAG: hypothetical protein WAL52_12310 [Candidatus Sulfotelmatobacter sp.]
MAQPTNETKAGAGILPDTELNPLVNPLLAAHMGRWAEVYFTSPPEKRAQAVSDLVRELSNDSSSPASLPVPPPTISREPLWSKVEDEAADSSAGSEQLSVQCESCGHKNAAPQRFCGMCGAPLTSSLDPLQPFEEPEPIAPTDWHQAEARPRDVLQQNPGSATTIMPVPDRYAAPNLPWPPPPENTPAEFTMLAEYQSEPARHPYRIYVGLFVAIVLGVLVYVTWRNNSAFWSSATAPAALPQAVPAAKSEAPSAGEPPATTSTQPNTRASSPPEAAPVHATAPSQNRTGPPPENDQSGENQHPQQVARTQPAAHPIPAAQTPASANSAAGLAGQSGSEELAAAEKYLNAGPGTARDSHQAAMLLWKAVAKQNLTATLLLSDLYLRGDGVSKSCDQARLLLDAAARKGAGAAAERLRNLQAFGCR